MIRRLSGQFVRFAGVGILGLMVDIGYTLILIELGLDALIARIFAIGLAMMTTWRLNRALTFGASTTSQASEGMRYITVAIAVALVNYAIYAGLLMSIPSLSPAIAVVVAVAIATGLSFTGYRFFAFKTAA
ncbi:MAG: GtrA family protein [Pseudomonadota bacterium]